MGHFSVEKKKLPFSSRLCANQQNVSFRVCRHKITLFFFSGSFQRPSASTTFASIIRLTTYFRGGTEQFRANFIFSLVSSSLSKLSIPPDHSSFSTFFFLSRFLPLSTPRARIKKTPETVGIAFGDFFLSRAGVQSQFCCTSRRAAAESRNSKASTNGRAAKCIRRAPIGRRVSPVARFNIK